MPETDANLPSTHPDTQAAYFNDADDEISLKDLILNLWYYRKIIVVLSISVIFVIAAAAAWVYLSQSEEKVVSLEFRLDFEGADNGEYPNGLKFSTADILSTPVLSEIYAEKDLQRYIEFPEFKAGLSIYQNNDALRFMEYEYAEKLSQKKLSLEERDRLETEFLEKKKSVLVPVYTFTFRYSGLETTVPEVLIFGVLNDILRIWANYADRVRGVNKYQYSLVSRNILSEQDLEDEDYFITTDMLRTTIDRVGEDIKQLQRVPGAKMIKVGEKAISLQDLQFRIEDIEQFKLSPLIGLIRQSGVSKDKLVTLSYLRSRLFELSAKEEEASANVTVYENSLNQYNQRTRSPMVTLGGDTALTPSLKQGIPGNVPTMIPQFGASFLDSLIEMAQKNSDMLFRQKISQKVIEAGLGKVVVITDKKYYQELYDIITSNHTQENGDETYEKATIERIHDTHKEIYHLLMQTIDEINAIYLDLSKYNLNPESLFYSLTKPITLASMQSLTLRKTLMYTIMASVFAISAIFIGVLLMSSITGSGRERYPKNS